MTVPNSNFFVQPLVEPIVIRKQPRQEPKTSSTQSSNDYNIVSNVKCVDPIVIRKQPRQEPKTSSTQSSNEYNIVMNEKSVAPIVSRRQPGQKPKMTSNLSSNDNKIQSRPDNDNVCADGDLYVSGGSSNSDEDLFDSDPDIGPIQDIPNVSECNEDPFVPIQLSPSDVPGYNLPHPLLEKNTVDDLKRWLKVRNIQHDGRKRELTNKLVYVFKRYFSANWIISLCLYKNCN